MVVAYKIWWTYIGTLSDFATLLWHNTTKRLPTSEIEARDTALQRAIVTGMVAHVKCQICMYIFTSIAIKECCQRIVLFTIPNL
jgi:hypothetical protein